MRVLQVTVPLPTADAARTTAPVGRQIDSLRRIGVEIDHLEVGGPARLKYLTTIPELRRRARHVDLIHAHYSYCGWLARAARGIPVVVSFMGTDLLGAPNPDGSIRPLSKVPIHISRLVADRFEAVIVKSEEMAQVIDPVPAHVVPNGVDTDHFRPLEQAECRRRLGWGQDRTHVLFPGNPRNPRKNHPLAREAVDVAADILGRPIELQTLWEVQPSEVPRYMNGCDAMLMASYLEGSPNVVKEAMACDLPVVAVPVGDVERLLAGVSGYTVCQRDPVAMGQALATTLNDPSPACGRQAIERQGLDLESVARRLTAIYDEVLA